MAVSWFSIGLLACGFQAFGYCFSVSLLSGEIFSDKVLTV